jgi:hypothetical protein
LGEAIEAVEAAALRYVLAVEEEGPVCAEAADKYERLKVCLYELQQARARAMDFEASTGRPCLVVVDNEGEALGAS